MAVMAMTDDDVTTIADRLPENFVDKLAEKAGGYRTNIDLEWPEDAPAASSEVEDLIEAYSPKTGGEARPVHRPAQADDGRCSGGRRAGP